MATDFKKYVERINKYSVFGNCGTDLCPIGAVLVGSAHPSRIKQVNKMPSVKKAIKVLRSRGFKISKNLVKYIINLWDWSEKTLSLKQIQKLGLWKYLKEGLKRLDA